VVPLLWHCVKTVQFIGWIALAVGLTQFSCGGSKPQRSEPAPAVSETKPATEAKPPEAPDPRPVLVAFGDSLTAGFGADPGFSYPDFLQKDLDKQGLRWRVVNAGVSGDTTTDGVNRLPEVLAYRPRVVILEFGGNDGLRGLPLTTTRANLDQMIDGLEKSGAKIILAGMTLPPNYGSEYIQGFQTIYKELAAKYKLTLIPFLLSDVALRPNLMQRDGIHPTAEGNEIVARTVLKFVKPMLRH
jgi:acyl-CoA thioesterase-1